MTNDPAGTCTMSGGHTAFTGGGDDGERHRSIPAEIVAAGMHEMDPTARVLAMLAARGKTSVAEVTSRKKSAG